MTKLPQVNKKLFLAIIFIFTFIVANVDSFNTASNFSIAKKFPKNINEWNGEDFKLEKNNSIFSVMLPEDVVLRVYKKSDTKISMALILANDKKKIHDPQVCYKLQGFIFLDRKKIKLAPALNVNLLRAQKANKEYSFIFWYTDLDTNYTTRTEFWRTIICKKIFEKPIKTYGIVILYTPVKNEENLRKFALQVNYILFTKIKG
jgi:hypothetical protein